MFSCSVSEFRCIFRFFCFRKWNRPDDAGKAPFVPSVEEAGETVVEEVGEAVVESTGELAFKEAGRQCSSGQTRR